MSVTTEKFLSAHRTFIQADLMRVHFIKEVKNRAKTKKPVDSNFFVTDMGTYMVLWYSLLFALLSYLKPLDAIPVEIRDDVNAVYDFLKKHRNATFHIQNEYYSKKILEIVGVKDSAIKINRIHEGLSDFFHECARTRKYPF